ncbi:MAG: DNA-directed RNA polymerase subunit beta [Patescibacteria group bacterium]
MQTTKLIKLGKGMKKPLADLPNLIEAPLKSYNDFLEKGIKSLFQSISPIRDYTENLFELKLVDFRIDEPSVIESEAIRTGVSYTVPVRAVAELLNKQTGEIKSQEIFLCDVPKMTSDGYFVINGIKRVVINQLIRSTGIFFTKESGVAGSSDIYGAKIIPETGAWLELEVKKQLGLSVKVDQGKTVNWFTFLACFGFSFKEIEEIFKSYSRKEELFSSQIFEITKAQSVFAKNEDQKLSTDLAIVEFYKKIRPGDMITLESGKTLFENMFQNEKRYSLGDVGRFKLNRRIGNPDSKTANLLDKEDLGKITYVIFDMILNNLPGDDIDHLAYRRVKSVGEQVADAMRIGIARFERIVKDRMSTVDMEEEISAKQFLNIRPISASIESFFASAQLSQFMDETNPIAELAHKRRLSSFGPGGLKRERAGFEVRDIHNSHYGRICPIETPEGPNIGLVTSIASYGKINDFGFIESPYVLLINEIFLNDERCVGLVVREAVLDKKGKILLEKGDTITKEKIKILQSEKIEKVKIYPLVSNEIMYLMADQEEKYYIAQFSTELSSSNQILADVLTVRVKGEPQIVSIDKVGLIEVSNYQMISITTSLVPFIEHNPSVRILAGSNMNRQAVPLLETEVPLVYTGVEKVVARYSGHNIFAPKDGIIDYVDAEKIILKDKNNRKIEFKLKIYERTNQNTAIRQTPKVSLNQEVREGDLLAEGFAMKNDELALGKNILVAFMAWNGFNFADAIVISSRLVKQDIYTSVRVEEYVVSVRETNLGPEETTRDIPGKSEYSLRNLDDEGIVRVGSEVKSGDILVGKVTPRGKVELTAEERLLFAIFGEKSQDKKDTSLKLPHGDRGRVIDIQIFTRENGDNLPVGILKMVKVYVAQIRKISVGDKMAARYGNKGVVAKIVPEEDMPFLADGTPVDIVLNPLGVVARMNIGQVLESHLGMAAKLLNARYQVEPFSQISWKDISEELKKAGFSEDGKVELFDGQTGEKFKERVAVGYMYVQKLIHMSEDKIHARSVGPYSLITQQPLGGKAQFGGQRLGEMEVWALEAHGASRILQEMLTIKSDDVIGRAKAYESIVKNEGIGEINMPASFHVLLKELQGIGLKTDLLKLKKDKLEEDEE